MSEPVCRSSDSRFCCVMDFPRRRMLPLLGFTSPSSIFMVVDFPAPFGPMKP